MCNVNCKIFDARQIVLNNQAGIEALSDEICSKYKKEKNRCENIYIILNLESNKLTSYEGEKPRKLYFPETSELIIPCEKYSSFYLSDYLSDSYVLKFFDIMCEKQNK